VQRFFDQQAAKGRAPATVLQQRAILRRALNVAVQDDILARNPVTGTRIRGPDVQGVRPLDPGQVGALLRAARRTPWHSPLALAVSTGLRPGELLGLTWGDVDLEARTLRVRQSVQRFAGRLQVTGVKSQRSRRTIPLPAIAVTALKKQFDLEPVLLTAYVFRTRNGGPIEHFTRAFKRYADRAGLPKTTRLYDLRHSCASLLLAAGEHPRVVACSATARPS
jgi:integrase